MLINSHIHTRIHQTELSSTNTLRTHTSANRKAISLYGNMSCATVYTGTHTAAAIHPSTFNILQYTQRTPYPHLHTFIVKVIAIPCNCWQTATLQKKLANKNGNDCKRKYQKNIKLKLEEQQWREYAKCQV